MENNEVNPLASLGSVKLTDTEKEQMWQNIVHIGKKERTTKSAKKPSIVKRRLLLGGVIATTTLALVGYENPHFLNIGSTFDLLTNKMFSSPQISKPVSLGYGEKVNQSVTSHGITLTIGNIYADPTKLEFGMVESFTSFGLHRPIIQDGDMTLSMNGSRKLTGFSGGQFRAVSGGRYAGVVYFPVMNDRPYKLLPDTFTLNVHVHQIGNVKGNWSFSIPVSQQKLQHSTRDFHPNARVSNNGYVLDVTDVKVSPAQMRLQSTLTMPTHGKPPDRMEVIDNEGHVIGGDIIHEKTIRTNQSTKVVEMTIVGNPPSSGASKVSVTPVYFHSSSDVSLQGPFPKTMTVQEELQAKIEGIHFNANNTVVDLSMNQATYRRLVNYKGHKIGGQFFLVSLDSHGSDAVGSEHVEFASSTSNKARIIFGKVDPKKQWGIERTYSQAQPALDVKVPLR